MTEEGPGGKRYLPRKDGTLVTQKGVIRLDDLDPASQRIVRALLAQEPRVEPTQAVPTEGGRKLSR